MLKKIVLFLIIVGAVPGLIFAQFKNQDKPLEIRNELMQPSNNQYLGLSFLDPSKLSISHSVSMSYLSMGENSLSRSVYLNTLRYQIASPLLLSVQWGVQSFPHNNLAKDHPAFQNGFFVSGAELRYQPSDKFEMRLQYSRNPGVYGRNSYYNPMFGSATRSWWDNDDE